MTRLFMCDAYDTAQRRDIEARIAALRARLPWCDRDEAVDVQQQVEALEAVLRSMRPNGGAA